MRYDTNTCTKNRWLIASLTIALVFAASMPQGYMLSRGADNIVEIVVCRGFGAGEQMLYLNVDTGEYVPQSGDTESHEMGSEMPNQSPCEFTLLTFDELSEFQFGLALGPTTDNLAVTLRHWDIVGSSIRLANPRAPPAIS